MSAFGYRKPGDLPQTIAVFPLLGVILFPRGQLPLNIFEPRYLNMVDDALSGDRLIGMIQLASAHEDRGLPDLAQVGTAGRITSFAETDDGRYLITLTGIARFRVAHEMRAPTPYRQVLADYAPFADDLDTPHDDRIERDTLRASLRRYADAHGLHADWAAVNEAPSEVLVNAVAQLCPFEPGAKQGLLEAGTLSARCAALIALLDMDAGFGGRPQ